MAADDIIRNPLKVVEQMFSEDNTVVNRLEEVGAHFKKTLQCSTNVPLFNDVSLDDIPAHSLVRYRGMVQDMLDPEFYLAKYNVTNTANKVREERMGCYTEALERANEQIDFNDRNNITLERQTYYCVPVPGENKWVSEMWKNKSTFVADEKPAPTTMSKKRPLTEQNGTNNVDDNSGDMDVDTHSTAEKKAKNEDGMSTSVPKETKADTFTANHPLPDGHGPTCYITVYSDVNELKMNEVCEFVCVLDNNNNNNNNNNNIDVVMSGDDENDAGSVVRLHCIYFTKLPSLNLDVFPKTQVYERTVKELASVRTELMSLLTQVFAGDTTVAEYFLLHLISNTYAVVGVLCVGKVSLNISNCRTEGLTRTIYKLMQMLTEKSYYLPLTINNLNKLKYTPRKDYEANRLMSGILQLSSDTNLVLDETQMQPGKLETDGVNNLKAIGNLIQWQNVEYDFKFSQVEMRTKVNTLVLSEGKSMLQCDCQLPITTQQQEQDTDLNTPLDNLTPQQLQKFRVYLQAVRALQYNLTDEVTKALEDDFVEMRKADAKAASAESFSLLLTTARFMAMSYGQGTLDAALWTRTKDLDGERRKRMTTPSS